MGVFEHFCVQTEEQMVTVATTTAMSSESQSIADTHKSKLSTFAKLRKSQSTPKLRDRKNSRSTYNHPITSYTAINSPTSNTATPTSSTVATTGPASTIASTRATTTPLTRKKISAPKTTLTTTKTTTASSSLGFFKKISHEWHSFIHRLKSISEDVFTVDTLIDELFVDDESDDHMSFDKLVRASKGYNTTEEKFLQDYKKYKSLDKMYDHYNGSSNQSSGSHNSGNNHGRHSVVTHYSSQVLNNHDVGSSTTVVSDQTSFNVRTTLQDVIRHHQAQFRIIDEVDLDSDGDGVEEEEEQEEEEEALDSMTATGSSTNTRDIPQYNDIDFTILRREFENMLASTTTTMTKVPCDSTKRHPLESVPLPSTTTSSTSGSRPLSQVQPLPQQQHQQEEDVNVGTILWNYRRRKWLYCPDRAKAELRIKQTSLSHIPKESYYKIYSSLINENRVLKKDKHINLLDLIKIVHVGWIEEKKWEP